MRRLMIRHMGHVVLVGVMLVALAGVVTGGQPVPEESERVDTLRIVPHVYARPELRRLVDSAANRIVDERGELLPFFRKLRAVGASSDSVVTVLHVGDSHVQAGFWTGRIRTLLQQQFGNAGRGLITPLRLSGTNEPRDYAIRTLNEVECLRCTESLPAGELSFTGISATMTGPEVELALWSKTPFRAVTVLHAPEAPMLYEPDTLSLGTYCTADNSATSTRIVLNEPVDSLVLRGVTSAEYGDPTFYGFSLESGTGGVLYHSTGINGAAFDHYIRNTDLLEGGAVVLRPDLIVVSLGTNNCFGNNFREDHVREVVASFIAGLRSAYPGVPLLFTTPMESCRRSYSKGRRVYLPNRNVPVVAKVIRRLTREQGVAYWDLYTAAGGEGAIGRWQKEALVGSDRIHLTEAGYELLGDMFYEAFVTALLEASEAAGE